MVVFVGIMLVHPHLSIGQSNTDYLTYTNTELGFTVEYPSDWTISEDLIYHEEGIPDTVYIHSPNSDTDDAYFAIQVNKSGMRTLEDLENEMVNTIKNFSLIEVNNDSYYLGGYPAVRIIAVGIPMNQTHESRVVDYETWIDGKQYSVLSTARTNLFSEFEPIFQRMVESFRVIKAQ